jgi:hypothetical protein
MRFALLLVLVLALLAAMSAQAGTRRYKAYWSTMGTTSQRVVSEVDPPAENRWNQGIWDQSVWAP